MRDLTSNIGAAVAIAPAVHTATATGGAVDLKGFNRVAVVVATGAVAGDGDFSVKLQDSSDGTNFADVAAHYADSNAPATLEANSVYKLGYRGHKRYIRAVLTKASGTSIAASAVAVLGDPAVAPVA